MFYVNRSKKQFLRACANATSTLVTSELNKIKRWLSLSALEVNNIT